MTGTAGTIQSCVEIVPQKMEQDPTLLFRKLFIPMDVACDAPDLMFYLIMLIEDILPPLQPKTEYDFPFFHHLGF